MKSIKVRKATIDDLETILDMNYRLFLWDIERDPSLNLEWTHGSAGVGYFMKRINNTPGICLVAEADSKIIGYVAGRVDETIAPADTLLRSELENIFVEDNYRSHGAGSLLVQELRQWCKDQGSDSMLVSAYWANTSAIEFYKSCGFTPYVAKLEMTLTETKDK